MAVIAELTSGIPKNVPSANPQTNATKITNLVCSYLENALPIEIQELSCLNNLLLHLQQFDVKKPPLPIQLNTPEFNGEPYFIGIEKCITDGKFDTTLALQYFKEKSALGRQKLDLPAPKSENCYGQPGHRIWPSDERDLIHEIERYFWLMGIFVFKDFPNADGPTITKRDSRIDSLRNEFLTLIKGIDFFSEGDRTYRCDGYAFDLAEWSIDLTNRIPSLSNLTIFLREKGYTQISHYTLPQIGDIRVYYRSGKTFFFEHVQHFGKVVRIEDSLPVIRSKWGLGHVYDHLEELAYSFYGDSVACFRPIENCE